MLIGDGGLWEQELDEGGQNVQTSSYELNKYQRYNVQYTDCG